MKMEIKYEMIVILKMIISTVVMVQYRLLIEYNLMTRMSKHKAKAPQRRVINRGNKNLQFAK